MVIVISGKKIGNPNLMGKIVDHEAGAYDHVQLVFEGDDDDDDDADTWVAPAA